MDVKGWFDVYLNYKLNPYVRGVCVEPTSSRLLHKTVTVE